MSKALRESKAAKLAVVAIEEAKMNDRLAAAEHDARVEAAIEEARAKGMEFAILKTRVFRSLVVAPGAKLARLLNDWETTGWTLINILQNGIGAVTVVSARVIEQPLELPVELEDEDSTEDAPPVKDVATDEGELKRQKWADEQAAKLDKPADQARSVDDIEPTGAVEGEDHGTD